MNKKEELAKVFHYDLYGKRDTKYEFLNNRSIRDVKWDGLERKEPQYFFVKKDFRLEGEYGKGLKVNDLLRVGTSGVKTHRDKFLTDVDRTTLLGRIKSFAVLDVNSIKNKFNLKDTRDWKISLAKETQKVDENNLKNFLYRPFDRKYIYYDLCMFDTGTHRYSVMKHFLNNPNYGLCVTRKFDGNSFNNILVTRHISDIHVVSDQTYIFPLYLYTDTQLDSTIRQQNFDQKMINEIAKKLNLKFIPDHLSSQELRQTSEHEGVGKKSTFNPLDILDYIYATLHSPTYRERYKEFLKIDFPRIPFTSDQKLFWSLVEKGRELREYHLMEHANSSKLITKFPISGENEITQSPKFDGSKVWINETQYFDKVPQIAWEFYIGGYQPAQKWLKDRKGRKLSFDEVLHYQKIIVALVNTDRVMKEIDGLIKEWPIK